MTANEVAGGKWRLIHQLFVRSADENYITARWCNQNKLWLDFAWSATHCLEKYMKAILLANGQSTKSYRHDICRLFERISLLVDRPLLTLIKPSRLLGVVWRDELASEFFTRLYETGNPDGRYNIYGHEVTFSDLWKLDQAVFSLRRIVQPLAEIGPELGSQYGQETWADYLDRNPSEYAHWGGRLEAIIRDQSHPLRQVLLESNYSYAPPDYRHQSTSSTAALGGSALSHEVFERLASDDPEQVGAGDQLAEWCLENIVLPGSLQDEIREAQRMAISNLELGAARTE